MKSRNIRIYLFFLAVMLFPCLAFAQADSKVTLTISPPLIKINMNPGERWNSSIKAVNNNSQAVQVYVEANDFRSNDFGGAEFVPASEAGDYKYSLVQWLEFNKGPIEIPAQQSVDIPFTINLPSNAEPGGHYSALLVGTKPPERITGSGIKVSSMLASLIMLQIKGLIEERGYIREFSTDKNIYQEPKVKFKVNFSNTGNVHLQPRGELKIYNFFNQEKGTIDINKNTEFGNVMPESGRIWEFIWGEKKSFLDMGRFKAVLFLNYGQSAQNTLSQTVYFWVIYVKPLLAAVGSLLFLIFIVTLLIRRYVKRAVISAQSDLGFVVPPARSAKHKISVIPDDNGSNEQKATVKNIYENENPRPSRNELSDFTKIFLAIISALAAVILIAGLLYFKGYVKIFNIENNSAVRSNIQEKSQINTADNGLSTASTDDDRDEVVKILDIDDDKSSDHIESGTAEENWQLEETPEAQSEKQIGETAVEDVVLANKNANLIIKVLNGSGVSGAASRAGEIATQAGYKISSVGNADNYDYVNSVIKHKASSRAAGEKLCKLLSGKCELEEISGGEADIIIIVGSSFK